MKEERPSFAAYVALQEAKAEQNFDASVTATIMKRLGFSQQSIDNAQKAYDSFGCAWFVEHFPSFPFVLGVKKVRRGLSFYNLVKAPTKTVIWEPYLELQRISQTLREPKPVALVFDIPDCGKWVCHSAPALDSAADNGIFVRTFRNTYPSMQIETFKSFIARCKEEWIDG